MQSIILGSFFYGYVITQIPAGYLAGQKIVSCKWLFGFGILFTSIFTVLMPLAAKTHYYLLLAIRVLEGMFLPFFEHDLLLRLELSKLELSKIPR